MKKNLSYIGAIVLLCSNFAFSQTAPDLASAASFVLFTGNGQFTSTSTTTNVTGDVGNVTGAFAAFPPGLLTGNKHIGDAVAIQANNDLTSAYADLAGRTGIAHSTSFGAGEILLPGVYSSAALSTFSGNLTLDAGGNSSAVFIIKVDAAFSSVTGAQVILANGATACNVYWQINGAVDLHGTIFKGTMLVNGAVNLYTGTSVEGRILTETGAFIFDDISATICNLSLLPIKLVNFDAAKTTDNNIQLTWVATSESNMLQYEVESSINAIDFHKVAAISSKGNNYPTQYSFKDADVNKTGTRFYRIKMVENNGSFTYSNVKNISFSEIVPGLMNISPNPAINTIKIIVNAEARENVTLSIINMNGQKVRQENLTLNKGINNINEDINDLQKSGYILSIKSVNTGKTIRQNFQKL